MKPGHPKSLATLTVLILLAGSLAGAGSATAHQDATSALLLPYFEVDLGGTGVRTIFSVINASADPVDVEIEIYSNWGIEILSTSVTIEADAVQIADLRTWLLSGKLLDRTLDAADLEHARAAFSGQRSPRDDMYYSHETAYNLAVGYVKIRAQGGPNGGENLFGEYFILDPEQDFAQGDFLVDIDLAGNCPGLCKRHGVRFLAGGGFDSGTEVVIWTDYKGTPSESAFYPDTKKTEADTMAYREDGRLIDHMGLSLLPLQVVKVQELGLSSPFGWLDLLTDRDTLVTLRLSAANRFSVGFKTSCLPPRPEVDTSLTLIKHVINDDGGVLRAADFRLFVDGSRVLSGVPTQLQPGTYTASEENEPGYIAGTWGGDCDPDGTVTLEEGDHKVCEITNDDTDTEPEPATLTLIKVVNGGSLSAEAFPLFANDTAMTTGVARELPPGTYTVREESQGDYNAQGWTGDCAGNASDKTRGTVTLAPGDDKVCTITNFAGSEPPTTLTLIKRVINDDGGTLGVSDFPLFIGDRRVTSGQPNDVDPGSYNVREQNQPDYTAGSWTGDCSADGSVTLARGDQKTCIITNDDDPEPEPATLTLIKVVVNDDGGTLGVSDFPLFVDGQRVTSGVAYELAPGTYTASEQNQDGYIAGDWTGDCNSQGKVTLTQGEHKTCTIVNDDEAPQVVPGRMTGGGSVFTDDERYTHGFELHCDRSHPNNLEINWGNGKANRFHLTELTSAACSDDPAIVEAPPVAGFDTFVGAGIGRFNGEDGATISFTFTDAGEPGKNDLAQFTIVPPDGGPAVTVSGLLHNGNHQAHGK